MYLSTLKFTVLFNHRYLREIVFSNDIKGNCADICIVLGGPSMIPYRVNKAFELYKKKKVKKILLSGGIGHLNLKRKNAEAELMKNYLLDLGVSDDDILVEDKSRNTYENFMYCYNMLKVNNGLDNSFILVTSDFHMRRAVLLFRSFFKDSKLFTYSVVDGSTDKSNWYKSFYGKRIVMQEAILLRNYARRGLIEDIEIHKR